MGGRGETSPFPNLQHPSQPPGPRPSAAARYRLSEALAAARLPLEFCPKKGGLEEEEEERRDGGRRRETESGVQNSTGRGEDQSRGGGGSSEALPLRPAAVHQRGRPDIPRMVNAGHYALVNRLRAAERLVLSIFSLALAFNLVSSGVCRGEDFISIG